VTIDVRKLAEEAELKSPDGNYRYRAIDRRIEAFANLVLEAASFQAEETICGSNDYGEIYGENAADAIRALKVKP
jgi:hypothetical protein